MTSNECVLDDGLEYLTYGGLLIVLPEKATGAPTPTAWRILMILLSFCFPLDGSGEANTGDSHMAG